MLHHTFASGALAASREEVIRAAFWSEGVRFPVREGDLIEPGQTLAELRAEFLARNIRTAEVNLQAARLNQAQLLREAEIQPERAQLQMEAAQREVEQASERMRATLKSVGRQTEAAAERVEQAKRNLDRIQEQFGGLAALLNEFTLAGQTLEQIRLRLARQPGDLAAQDELRKAEALYRELQERLSEQRQSLDRDLQQARSSLQASERDLADLKSDDNPDVTEAGRRVRQAEQAVAQLQTEHRSGAVLPEQLDHAATRLLQAGEELSQLRSQWEQRLPGAHVGGVVLSLPHKEGDPAEQGTTLAVIRDVSELKVNLRVDEGDLAWIEPGFSVSIEVAAYPQERFEGTITRIASQATQEAGKGTAMFAVEATVANPDGKLKPGMMVKAEIVTQVAPLAMLIPITAVQEQEGRQYVWTVQAGTAAHVEVVLGAQSRGHVEVRQGVAPGTQIVVGPPPAISSLREGAPVLVDSEARQAP